MVLSNKKLKQKLRAALAESVAGTADPATADSTPSNPDNPPSLKNLLGSATQTPRLSKREKRRKILSLQDPELTGASNRRQEKEADKEDLIDHGNDTDKKNKKKKKRKREGEGEGDGEDGELGLKANQTKKLKKKKNKKKKKKKKTKGEEQNKDVENESAQREVVKEAVQIIDSQENGDASNKVYVGGIPYYSTEDDICSYFDSCGTITEVDCMTFPESGKFRGIAIISFKTEAAAKRALALDGGDMGGLFLKIQPYRSTTRPNKSSEFAPEMVDGYNRIYVGNLSWEITEDELRKFFSGCKVSSIRFGMDKETQEFRGYAHVDFSDKNSLTMALKLDQEIVCGRPAKISCAVPKKGAKKDYPTSAPSSEKVVNDEALTSGNGSEKVVNDEGLTSGNGSEKAVNDAGVTSGSGKMKRRTCYECGEKGHISSACPKKQAPDLKNSGSS